MKESKELFAAANSGRGFANFYPQVFGREGIEHRYLIKGGPGTGKSTFMRTLATKAQENGLDVEYYRCSSDPESLDAVVLAGRIAVMDATSPHCVDADIAGAVDEIVDLGAFWDANGLEGELEQIKALSKEKKNCYRTAYGFLESAMVLDDLARELGNRFLKREKMQRAVCRLVGRIPKGSGYSLKVGIRDSIGMKGRVCLDTYEASAHTVYLIKDFFKSGSAFIALLAKEAQKNGNAITVSYCPLNPTHPDAILFEESGVVFALADEARDKDTVNDYIYINMKRFVEFKGRGLSKSELGRIKGEHRACVRLSDGLVESAVSALRAAGEYHFMLEEIYKRYMDFEAESAFADAFSSQIVSRLCGDK